MKRASWVLPATSWLALLAVFPCPSDAAPEAAARVTSASFAVDSPGRFERDLAPALETPSDLTWMRVELPHVRRRVLTLKPADYSALLEDFVTAWYRIELPATADATSQALYLPRWGTWG